MSIGTLFNIILADTPEKKAEARRLHAQARRQEQQSAYDQCRETVENSTDAVTGERLTFDPPPGTFDPSGEFKK